FWHGETGRGRTPLRPVRYHTPPDLAIRRKVLRDAQRASPTRTMVQIILSRLGHHLTSTPACDRLPAR
ncbi:MAG: hypothetical protein ACYC0V_17335, partial [Armatimonadota bacterium]